MSSTDMKTSKTLPKLDLLCWEDWVSGLQEGFLQDIFLENVEHLNYESNHVLEKNTIVSEKNSGEMENESNVMTHLDTRIQRTSDSPDLDSPLVEYHQLIQSKTSRIGKVCCRVILYLLFA